ncbi:MAG: glycosyltransferase family 2 protein [Vicinamibacteraceae bacterium]
MSALTIVIVSFNAREDLARCLGSLRDAPPAIAHEIVVVDNASSDGSAETASAYPGVRLIALPENRGFAAANNVGIRATSGDLILLLNSDTIVPSGAIDGLVRELDKYGFVAAAGPRLVDADGQPELSLGEMVAPLAEWRQKRLLEAAARGERRALAEIDFRTSWGCRPHWVSGACLLVKRAEAEAVGLLDERYFMYLEDVDFCAALRASGQQILFAPEVTVTHLRGRSRQSAPAATTRHYRDSHRAFYAKHHPAWAPLLELYLRLKGA